MKTLTLIVLLLSLTASSFGFNPLRKMARQRRLKVSEDTAAIKNPRVKSFNREMAQKLFSSMHPQRGSSQATDLSSLKPKVKKLSARFPVGMQPGLGQNFNAQQLNSLYPNQYSPMSQYNPMAFGGNQNGLQSMMAANQQHSAMSNYRQTAGFASPFNTHPLAQSGGPGGGRFGKNRKFHLVTPEEHQAALKAKQEQSKIETEETVPKQPLRRREKRPIKPEQPQEEHKSQQEYETKDVVKKPQSSQISEPKTKPTVQTQNPPKETPQIKYKDADQNREFEPTRRARVDEANVRRYGNPNRPRNRQRNERRQFRNRPNQENEQQTSNENRMPLRKEQDKPDLKTLRSQQNTVENNDQIEETKKLDARDERNLDKKQPAETILNTVMPLESERLRQSEIEANRQLEAKKLKTKNLMFMIDDSKTELEPESKTERLIPKNSWIPPANAPHMSDAELEAIVDDPVRMQQLIQKFKNILANSEH